MTQLVYTFEDQLRDEREYGIGLGREEAINLLIQKMMSKGKSLEEISVLIDLSVEEIKKLLEASKN